MCATSRETMSLAKTDVQATLDQLQRILLSHTFQNSPLLSSMLNFIVQKTLVGQAQYIKQYTIAVDACGYSDDFDPHTNTAVRVLAGRLRRRLEYYYAHEGAHDPVIIEIPKRTYIPVFQINPMGQAETKSEFPGALASVVADYGPSIAVIAFNHRGANKALTAFANDISESIAEGLTRFRDMHIVGPIASDMSRAMEPEGIGQRYRVRFVLQGRVQTHGEVLRVTVGLSDTRTGFKIWSQTYQYGLVPSNLLKIQDTITQLVVSTLADHSGIIPFVLNQESMSKHHENLEVYEAIYRQEHYLKVFTIEAYLASVKALEHAIRAHPDNPIALAMLCNAYCINYMFDQGLSTVSLEDAERLAQRAIAIDPECQIAQWIEGLLRFLKGQADRCLVKLRLANKLNPYNANIIQGSALVFYMMGHWTEGLELWEQAMQLNPYHPAMYALVPFMHHYRLGKYEEAWNQAIRFATPVFWDPMIRAAAAGQLNRRELARDALQELLQMRPDFPVRARDLIRRLAYLDEHVDILLDGLYKAGLAP